MWNGPSGDHWVTHAERHDRALAPYGSAVLAGRPGRTRRACARRRLRHRRHDPRRRPAQAGDGSALGVDIGRPMVEAARAETAADGGLANVTFEQADAQVHPFAAGGFDVVLSRFGVMFFDDPVAAFANLRRAIADGGRLVFVGWQPVFANDWMLVPMSAMVEHLGMPDIVGPGRPRPVLARATPTACGPC